MSSSELGIGYDATFSLNEFGQPKIKSEIELIMNIVIFVCVGKPGQYPSLPWIGLDTQKLLYSHYDEIDEADLKDRLITQCAALGVFFSNNSIGIMKVMYRGEPSLLIHIEGKEQYPEGYLKDHSGDSDRYLIGISFDEFKKMVVNINRQGGE